VARYHLAPGLALQPEGRGAWWVMEDGTALVRVVVESGLGRVQSSRHAPAFGTVLPTQMLEVELQGGRAGTRWEWHS
jgi:hypothetical protein